MASIKSTRLLIVLLLLSGTRGQVTAQPPLQFDSLATFQFGTPVTDCWGYTAPDGSEYAIVGTGAGVVFVNATTLKVVDTVTGSGCGWQDIKTMGQYCYAVSECGTGFRVIDMQFLPDSVHLVGVFWINDTGLMSSHNLNIDTVAGYAYIEGNTGNQSVYYHDLSDPANPRYVGSFGRFGLHDLYVHNDTAYLAEGGGGRFSIFDMADKQNPVMLASVTVPGGGYLHNIWPTPDGFHVVTTEETAGKTVKIWNIQDLTNITMVSEFLAANQLAHNAHVEGDFLYLSHYEAGVQLLDISNPAAPVLLAAFDTWPQSDFSVFNGNWGIYPHNPSGFVYASNMDGKLFILQTPVNQSFPFARRINLGGGSMARVLNHTPTIYWSFVDTMGTQTAYELEVGTDNEWTVAENWATGQVLSSDTSVIYGGSPLVDGATYIVRIRVQNGAIWGDWRISAFSMNSVPSVPVLAQPVNLFEVVPRQVKLTVTNSLDAEADPLSYDFELYSDAALTLLLEARVNVAGQIGSTSTTGISNLRVHSQYWWRCRVTDGYEFSAWSSPSTFRTRESKSFRVPNDYGSISTGIAQAQFGDTLLVSPGVYTENLAIIGKSLIIISTDGAAQTFLRPLDSQQPLIEIDGVDSMTELSGFSMGEQLVITAIVIKQGGHVYLRHNTFRGFNSFKFLIDIGGADATLERNIFFNNGAEYCILAAGANDSVRVINNSFDNNRGAMASTSSKAVFMNNIVTNSTSIGVNGLFASLDYNDFWNNATGYVAVSPGVHDISLDPMFLAPASGDYSLNPGSPCIDAGNPDMQYNDADGSRNDIGALAPGNITDVDIDAPLLPSVFALGQNYPNPFNPSTTISFSLATRSHTDLSVYNLLGQQIVTLIEGDLSPGEHHISWNGRNASGHPVASGVYFYRLSAGGQSLTNKMMLLK